MKISRIAKHIVGAVPASFAALLGLLGLTHSLMNTAQLNALVLFLPLFLSGAFGVWSLWWAAENPGQLPKKHLVGLLAAIVNTAAFFYFVREKIYDDAVEPALGLQFRTEQIATVWLFAPIIAALVYLLASRRYQDG